MPAINLGTPRVPEILAPRRRSRQIRVGKVLVGGDAQVSAISRSPEALAQIRDTGVAVVEVPEAWALADIEPRTLARRQRRHARWGARGERRAERECERTCARVRTSEHRRTSVKNVPLKEPSIIAERSDDTAAK